MISAITLSNHGKNTLYLLTKDITKEDQEQSKSFFATWSYLSYIRGVALLLKRLTEVGKKSINRDVLANRLG
jgi:hypothetical protein